MRRREEGLDEPRRRKVGGGCMTDGGDEGRGTGFEGSSSE